MTTAKSAATILVIDDQASFLSLVKMQLQNWGYQVETCQNSVTAINLVKTGDFQMVLCDLHMPGIRGDQLLFQLHQVAPAIPCCLVTATGMDDPLLRQALKLSNVKTLIKKPVNFEQMQAIITRYVPLNDVSHRN